MIERPKIDTDDKGPLKISRDAMRQWAMERLEEFRVRYGHTEPIEAYIQALEVAVDVESRRHASVERLADQLLTRVIILESK